MVDWVVVLEDLANNPQSPFDWSPLPIDRYLSTMSVKSDGHGGSIVTWVGQFSRKNPRAAPPEAENDATIDEGATPPRAQHSP